MAYKLIVFLCIFCFSFFQTQSCSVYNDEKKQNEVREIFNINSKVELLFFCKKDSTYEQRKYFYENVLMKPLDSGYWTRDGVKAVFGIDKFGYVGYGIKFDSNATKKQKDNIKHILQNSPMVYRIYENVIPNKIDDLEIEKEKKDKIKFGPDKFTSLAVFFKKETTREQIETFYNDAISVSRPDLGGHDLPEGVALQYQIRNGDYEGVGITFSTNATPEQRKTLKRAIEESPIVYKVYKNVVPNEIKDL